MEIALALALAVAADGGTALHGAAPLAGTCVVDPLWTHAEETDAFIARRVPSYAGATSDTTLTVTIHVTDLTERETARRQLEQEMIRRFGRFVFKSVRYKRVAYSFRQLQSWHDCLASADSGSSFRISAVATSVNKVYLEAVDESARSRIQELWKRRLRRRIL